ncbi:MAG: AAA family ATPase [Deltaproteobacteria bacterium]|jgi:chromosome partitioning protein|nr:AAA family ATPase [Deltaproteobacteria bacterium]
MEIISIINQKGGVGKTTTAVNLSVGLGTYFDKKILLVDLDPQANASIHLGIEAEPEDSIKDVLLGNKKIKDIIVEVENIYMAPSNISLSSAEIDLINMMKREEILKNALKGLEYDAVVIDCPPSLSILTVNALSASNRVIVPVFADHLSLVGLSDFLKIFEKVRDYINPELEMLGYLKTGYDKRVNISGETESILEEHLKEKVIDTKIRFNTSLKEAPAKGISIFKYKKCRGQEDYLALAKEIYKKLWGN